MVMGKMPCGKSLTHFHRVQVSGTEWEFQKCTHSCLTSPLVLELRERAKRLLKHLDYEWQQGEDGVVDENSDLVKNFRKALAAMGEG